VCCLFLTLVFLGPRFFNFMWWLIQPARWSLTFNTFIFPLLGVIFIPWTTLMYVIISPGGVTGWDFMWLGLAFLSDIASYAGGGVKERNRIPGYPGDATVSTMTGGTMSGGMPPSGTTL